MLARHGEQERDSVSRNSHQTRAPRKQDPPPVAGRVPPHDLDAEAAVLSAILLSRDALDRVLEILKPEHFYSDANGRIYEAAVQLSSTSTPIDIVSVASWLRDREKLQQIGGSSYLAQLADATPAVAHVGAHAQVVFEKWRLRQLIATCQRIAAEGYGDVGTVQEFVDRAEQDVYQLAHRDNKSNVVHVKAAIQGAFAKISAAAERGDRITGISTGYDRFDAKTAGLHPGDLTVVAARPGMGKTSFVLNMAVNVATPPLMDNGHGETVFDLSKTYHGVVVFSLEMPREQLGMRMSCAEGRVDVGKVRQGQLQPDEWDRITEAASYLSNLPIWVDDTPAITLLEVRAKVRRIQAEFDRPATETTPEQKIGLVVIDYIQLMKGPDGISNREQEISAISRGLKQLSKELGVHVIGLSQLNRAVETRSTKDKRPQLSDLRECVASSEWTADPRTGAILSMAELAHTRSPRVYGLNGQMRSVGATVADVWSTGSKDVLRVRTRTGRSLRCTHNHPLLTVQGWRAAGELKLGDHVALVRSVPEPTSPRNQYTDDELRLLGYLVCDGSYSKWRSVSYVKGDPELVSDISTIVDQRFEIPVKPKPCKGKAKQVEFRMDRSGPNANALIEWLKEIGIHGQKTETKALPWNVFESDNRTLGVLLGATWAGDGTVVARKSGRGGRLKFTSVSTSLIDQVSWMLSRLGIVWSKKGPFRNTRSKKDLYELIVDGRADVARFAKFVPVPGSKGRKLKKIVESRGRKDNTQLGRLPVEVTNELGRRAKECGVSWSQLGYRCQGKAIAPADLRRCAVALDAEELAKLASDSILWDPVVSIQPDGAEECFDARVPATGSFMASGFFVHNSGAIEQDADMIVFIYRDEYYNPETTNAKGIAELIIAKQRNGPTGKVLTRFTSSCTRFDNLAHGDYPEEESE